jgi:hypothetical protein
MIPKPIAFAGSRRSIRHQQKEQNLRPLRSYPEESGQTALTRGSFGGYEFGRMVVLFARAACQSELRKKRILKLDEAGR